MNIITTIGGTGSKVGESLVYLMAAGLIKGSYELFIIDKDKTCENTERETTIAKDYGTIHGICNAPDSNSPALAEVKLEYERLAFDPLFGDLLREFGIDPTKDELSRADSLKGITKPERQSSNAEALNLVYPSVSQERKLTEGFYAEPFLGAAVFRAIERTNSYRTSSLYEKIRNAVGANETVKIFLIASIFGGTGATFFPNIAKSIRKEFNNQQNKIQISGVLMLPYFALPSPPADAEKKIEEKDLQAKAAIAVEQYLTTDNLLKKNSNDNDYIFDSLYFMGLSHGKTSETYSLGGKTQVHKLCIMDLYASLAVCDFFNNFDPNVNGKQIIVPVFPNENTQKIDWTKLPNAMETKEKLLRLTRFSTFILVYLKPLLDQTDEIYSNKLIGHLYGKKGKFFNLMSVKADISDKQKDKLKEQVDKISNFCKRYLTKYALEIQSSQTNNGNICNLFNEEGICNIVRQSEIGFERSKNCNLNEAIPVGVITDKKCPSTGDEVVEILMSRIPKEKGANTEDETFIRQLLQQIYMICGEGL